MQQRPKPAERAKVLLQPGQVFFQRQLNQPPDAGQGGPARVGLAAEQAEVHLPVLDLESRPGLKPQTRPFGHGDSFGQVAKGPAGETELLPLLGSASPGREFVRRRAWLGLPGQLPAQFSQVAPGHETRPIEAHHFDAGAEMRRHGPDRPRGDRHFHAIPAPDERREVVGQRLAARLQVADDFRNLRRQRHQLAAQGLGQQAQQLRHLRLAQAGHRPFNGRGRQILRQRRVEPDGDSVLFFAGLIRIGHRHRLAAQVHRVGKCPRVELQLPAAREVRLRHPEQAGLGVRPQPAVQFGQRRHVFDSPAVKLEQGVIQVGEVLPPGSRLPDLDFLPDAAVVFDKGVARRKRAFVGRVPRGAKGLLAGPGGAGFIPARIRRFREQMLLDQGRAQEDAGGFLRVDVAVGHFAAAHLQSPKGGDLLGQHAPRLGAPVGILVDGFAQMGRQFRNPQRVYARHRPRK